MITTEQHRNLLLQALHQAMEGIGKWLGNMAIQDVVIYDRTGSPLLKCEIGNYLSKSAESKDFSLLELSDGRVALCYYYADEELQPTNICVYGKDHNGSSFSFRSIIHN
jgi:hypothetical protein